MNSSVAGRNVSRETFDDLIEFRDLVLKWTPKINLISAGTVPELWERHIVDSAQLYQLAPASYDHWVDIGSGGGFPGVVMAIYAKENNNKARFTFIESDQRKATFLRTAVRALSLNASVMAERIEDAIPQEADIVSARALTTLSMLIPLAKRHLEPSGIALFHKGKTATAEITKARQDWVFELEQTTSFTDPEARLLTIQRISRVNDSQD